MLTLSWLCVAATTSGALSGVGAAVTSGGSSAAAGVAVDDSCFTRVAASAVAGVVVGSGFAGVVVAGFAGVVAAGFAVLLVAAGVGWGLLGVALAGVTVECGFTAAFTAGDGDTVTFAGFAGFADAASPLSFFADTGVDVDSDASAGDACGRGRDWFSDRGTGDGSALAVPLPLPALPLFFASLACTASLPPFMAVAAVVNGWSGCGRGCWPWGDVVGRAAAGLA